MGTTDLQSKKVVRVYMIESKIIKKNQQPRVLFKKKVFNFKFEERIKSKLEEFYNYTYDRSNSNQIN